MPGRRGRALRRWPAKPLPVPEPGTGFPRIAPWLGLGLTLATGGAAAVATLVLFLVRPGDEAGQAAEPGAISAALAPMPGGAAAALRLRFRTGLKWQGCQAGKKGADCAVSDGASTMGWLAALAYCEGLDWGGQSAGWRLPDVKELASIVDDRRESPAIDVDAFPGTTSSFFWSSSSYAGSSDNAWSVAFNGGNVNCDDRDNGCDVHCVRAEP